MIQEDHEIFNDLEAFGQQDEMQETELLNAIAIRVQELLNTDKGLLLSYMYRLDIAERKIAEALENQGDESIAHVLAKLILQRQKDRLATKKKYKQPPITGWEY
jgi:hypothetical protein